MVAISEEEKVVNVPTDKISKAIEEVRSGICKTIKSGHIRMWFSVTASGKFVVAEASQEGGVEVQFDCVSTTNKGE